MPKHVKFRKTVSLMALAVMLLAPLAACGHTDDDDTLSSFFAYLQNAEYPRIYALLTAEAKSRVSLVDLSKRYQDIYSSIGIKSAECRLTNLRDADANNRIADFSLTATADKLGQFTLDMQARLKREDGVWRIDWTTELILPGLEEGDRAALNPIAATRGDIFDAGGDALATNDYALSVYVDTGKVKNYDQLIRQLAPLVGMTEKDIRGKLSAALRKEPGQSEPDYTVPPGAEGVSMTADTNATRAPATPSPSPSPTPQSGASESVSLSYVIKSYPKGTLPYETRQKLLDISGVGIDETSMTIIRAYPYGDLLAQTLGYTGVMTAEDLVKPENANLPRDARVGQKGLEQAWEQDLRAQTGYELVILGAGGNRKATLAHQPGSNGNDLRLTIDLKLQQTAEMLLREYLTPEMTGSIIVLDPKTGYIQAMASLPSFDPNLFSLPVDAGVYKALNDDPRKPFINRPTSGQYPPGSTFKPFTAAMGLTDGVINTGTVFPYAVSGNHWLPGDEWGISDKPITRSDSYSGEMNLQNAITYSDNIFFSWVALKVGGDKFYQHCLDLGLGLESEDRMKFDLPLAVSSITNSGRMDNPRMLADSGYGQGQFQITPLQMAMLFGSLANGGDIMQPRVVKSVNITQGPNYVEVKTFAPTVWRKGVVSQKNLNILLPYLKRVAQMGTARALNQYKNLKDYEICAKTGTAEIGNDKTREIAWLMAFTTKKIDRLVCVCLEVPADGGKIRTEIAKRMLAAEASPTGTEDPEGTGNP
jgi:penicillin-binding protein